MLKILLLFHRLDFYEKGVPSNSCHSQLPHNHRLQALSNWITEYEITIISYLPQDETVQQSDF